MLLVVSRLRAQNRDSGQEILNGVDLTVRKGEIHAIMGPNGSGKSTLANVIMGNPKYRVTDGDVLFERESIINLTTDQRVKRGLFMTFQHPFEITGVRLRSLIMASLDAVGRRSGVSNIIKKIDEIADHSGLERRFLDRYVNVGFSGGEKKRSEVVQFGLLRPKLAILDEIDSGLDVDSLRKIADVLKLLKEEEMSLILITHYQRLLDYLVPDYVHVYDNGRVIRTGGPELAMVVEKEGYSPVLENVRG
ncbi:MAG TPA: Fe-S cluster assembly ATPase SufC [Kosmotogaceae bacterium]|nr:MAG: FeS assembly ATPase SufC [Thermotogales bacterium 46_20]HAA85940.1 Fe-S cluster assembly ATPase SufC [Kosmotogaceae bacterium]